MGYIKKKVELESSGQSKQKVEVLSIVIPTFNSAKLLSICLEALEKQTEQKSCFEVTVADDGSTDETLQMLQQFKARSELQLQWTTIPNSGPGNARNAGVALSSGTWIGFMDADVIPHPDWVKNALKLIQQKPEAGAFEGRTEVTQRSRATPFTHQTENLDGGRYPTCNFLVRRNLAHFHPAYHIFIRNRNTFREDTDLAFSILAAGFSIIFAPELIVEHPPLPSSYLRPLVLAQRYYYDGLLSRRFPSRYRNDLDAHQIIGLKIPHLKKKLYSLFMISQIVFLGSQLLDLSDNSLFLAGSAYLLCLLMTSGASLRFANWRDLSLKDWLVFICQQHVLPWVMGYSLFRGWLDFRGEPEYSDS